MYVSNLHNFRTKNKKQFKNIYLYTNIYSTLIIKTICSIYKPGLSSKVEKSKTGTQ